MNLDQIADGAAARGLTFERVSVHGLVDACRVGGVLVRRSAKGIDHGWVVGGKLAGTEAELFWQHIDYAVHRQAARRTP